MNGDLFNRIVEKEEKKEQEIMKNKVNDKQEITMLNIELLDEFENHIFSALSQNKFEELKESISRSGVLSPIIVRKKQDRYEIISGHNRVKCSRELNINEVPAIIKKYDDDMAELIMIETNLAQRENILICEKAEAYKIRNELLKKLRKENSIKSSDDNDYEEKNQFGLLESSIEKLADESDESPTQLRRYIRLTELVLGIKNKLNNDIIPFGAGYELSFISTEEQEIINETLDETNKKVSLRQAEMLRAIKGNITKERVIEILCGKKKVKKTIFTGRVLPNIAKKYNDKFLNDKEFSELIDFLLENYYKNLSDKRRTK